MSRSKGLADECRFIGQLKSAGFWTCLKKLTIKVRRRSCARLGVLIGLKIIYSKTYEESVNQSPLLSGAIGSAIYIIISSGYLRIGWFFILSFWADFLMLLAISMILYFKSHFNL